ncbi:uncharacterized protein [Apostichopus japonicus]|uniref:uncharacterized protein n=1 Tax=Stichopus japonicus TaxID=307972 RepID=UPI003AB6A83B
MNIYPTGSHPARIYGLPKTHKCTNNNSFPTFRPIVSSIGTYNYNLAKFLSDLISPNICLDYCTQDSFSFVQEITSMDISDHYMVSYDVVSLFTNIPLSETVDIAIDAIMYNNPGIGIERRDLQKLFMFATSQTHFLFNGNYYDQVDGVAMGSPLAPVLANLFMGHLEKQFLNNSSAPFKPYHYRRYVDDIFCLFRNEGEAIDFLQFINTRHPNIKFTIEKQKDSTLPFLDVLVSNTGHCNTSVYHKPTYSGLLTNFFSFIPFSYKIGLIKTLVDRMYKVNNSWKGFDLDLKGLISTLGKNQFPSHLIDKVVKSYLQNKVSPKNIIDPVSHNTRFYKLPYIGNFSGHAQNKVRQLIKSHCTDIDVKLVFISFKVRNMCVVKDMIPSYLKSRVVYKFICTSCNACYIGETHRHLSTRISEHLKNR